ncbi:MAG: bacillithiol biosynthesis deacetylase BshB1 [Caldisericaceae bacterium]|nr:bacillithiol biosynthesis deacetylase BshB1 [Caldisericaceae bacterium]
MQNAMKLDVLAFGTHPDDVELFCGGTIASLVEQGYRVGIVDLTRGELGTRGDVQTRQKEAEVAANILGVHIRENAGLADGNIEINSQNRHKLISLIRKFQPKLVLLPFNQDRHPDHEHASRLISEACFYAGLSKIEDGQQAHRPSSIIFYFSHYLKDPSFVVDISEFFKTKRMSLEAYESQFYTKQKQNTQPETYISSASFWQAIEIRARFYGHLIGVEYGEPFFYCSPLKINNLFEIFA